MGKNRWVYIADAIQLCDVWSNTDAQPALTLTIKLSAILPVALPFWNNLTVTVTSQNIGPTIILRNYSSNNHGPVDNMFLQPKRNGTSRTFSSTNIVLPSLKLTVRPCKLAAPKGNDRIQKTHPFSGVNSLLFSGRVYEYSKTCYGLAIQHRIGSPFSIWNTEIHLFSPGPQTL